MSGAIPLLSLYAFVAWTRSTLIYTSFQVMILGDEALFRHRHGYLGIMSIRPYKIGCKYRTHRSTETMLSPCGQEEPEMLQSRHLAEPSVTLWAEV